MDKNSSTYALRSKFKVSLERFGLAQNYFDNAMNNAMVMSSSTLQNVLWNMSFNESREEALNSLRLTTEVEKEDASFKFIPLELVTLLRNELRFQFSVNINREFMKENDEQLTSYKKFVKSFGTDAIITYCIYQFVKVFLQVNYGVNNGLIEKTIWLLKSSNENYKFGGLKNLNLRQHEALALMEKSQVIGIFLSEYFDECQGRQGNYSSDAILSSSENLTEVNYSKEEEVSGVVPQVPQNLPLIEEESSTKEEDKLVEQQVEHVEGETTMQQNIPVAIPPELDKIVANADLVDDFIRVYDEVRQAGLDPDYLVSKKETITRFLDSYFSLLEETCGNL